MRKENEIVKTKEQFIENVSKELTERIFSELEEIVDCGEKEYWENSFIKVSAEEIVNLVKEVFKENRGESILEECPKTSEEIWRIASTEVEKRLSEHDFVLGFNTDGNLGIGNVKSGLVPIEKPLYIKNKLTVEEGIDELDLPNWMYKRLKQEGIITIGDLINITDRDETKNIRGIGKKAEQEIKRKLIKNGFKIS